MKFHFQPFELQFIPFFELGLRIDFNWPQVSIGLGLISFHFTKMEYATKISDPAWNEYEFSLCTPAGTVGFSIETGAMEETG